MNNEEWRKRLMKLDISEIEILREDYRKTHPKEASCVYLCNDVIKHKQEKADKADFERMLEEIEKKKNAQDSAATPSQGNETR